MDIAGSSLVDHCRLPFSTNVTSAAWVALTFGGSAGVILDNCRCALITDTGAQPLLIGAGPAGSEVVVGMVHPNQNNVLVPLLAHKNQRIALKAVSSSATTGEINIALFY